MCQGMRRAEANGELKIERYTQNDDWGAFEILSNATGRASGRRGNPVGMHSVCAVPSVVVAFDQRGAASWTWISTIRSPAICSSG